MINPEEDKKQEDEYQQDVEEAADHAIGRWSLEDFQDEDKDITKENELFDNNDTKKPK